jgi:hypothetical protein
VAKRLERLWIVPSLDSCRAHFAKAAKAKIQWNEYAIPTHQPFNMDY